MVGAAHLAISDLRVFGNAGGSAPRTPAGVKAVRSEDPRMMTVSWRRVPGAVGYNVLWGVKPDRLNLCYQVFADRGTQLDVRALTAGVEYHVAHPQWNAWHQVQAKLEGDTTTLYGPAFAEILRGPPASAFVADGSPVTVYSANVLQPVMAAACT